MKLVWPERAWIHALVVAAVSAAVYANSLYNGFALDDNYIILSNPRVHNLGNLAAIWLNPYWIMAGAELGLYRPGIVFLYALQWFAGGGDPWFFHAVSVALHVAVSVLVLVLLRRLAGTIPAFVGALVFAVHPIHTEAVANVVGQAELVVALCVLAACIIHSSRPAGVSVSWWRRLATVFLFAAALTSKESAVVLPALLIIVDLTQRRVTLTIRGLAEYADAILMPLILLAATLTFYLILRYEVMGGALIGVNAAPSMPFLREEYRVLNALRAFPEFMRLLLFPLDLAADYSPAALLPVDAVRPMVVLGVLLLTGLSILALLTPWLPKTGFPAAWFLISIITVSNLFFPIGVVIAERTLYLPSVAVAALVAFALQATAVRMSRTIRRATLVLVPVVVILLGVRTWVRNPVWDSTETVWASMLRDQPQSYRTQWIYAMQLWNAGRYEQAEARFQFAHRLYPRDGQMLTEWANFMMARGRFDEAVTLLETAHEFNPWIVRTTVTLMHAYLATGRYEDAIRTAETARRTGGSAPTALAVRAFAMQQTGRFPEAVAAWRVAIAHAPAPSWGAPGFLARSQAAAGYPEAALAWLDTARAAIPDSRAHAVFSSVERAIRDGCYRREADALRSASSPLPPEMAFAMDCDEFGHPFTFIHAGQIANASQNAMTPIRSDTLDTPPRVP